MAKGYDDINGVFSYEKSFKEWLEEVFESRASSDYPSRLRKFFTQYYNDGNMSFQGQSLYQCLNKLPLGLIQRWLDHCLIQAENISDSKERSNIKSAINKFRIFIGCRLLGSLASSNSSSIKLSNDDISNIEGYLKNYQQICFSKDELYKIFLTQFKSEDRRLTTKTGIIYPIKAIGPFINRETGDRFKMTRFFNDQSSNIKILLGPLGECRLSEIDSLILESPDTNNFRQVSVSKGGKTENVYTQDGNRLVRFKVKTSSDINRDHDKAIANILNGLDTNAYPCFTIVSEACRNTKSKKPTEIQKSLRGLLNNKAINSVDFANRLFDEIKKLFRENLSFTLMEGRANRQKSASI